MFVFNIYIYIYSVHFFTLFFGYFTLRSMGSHQRSCQWLLGDAWGECPNYAFAPPDEGGTPTKPQNLQIWGG